ncbi:MAG: hypothetical protein WCW66_01610 [Patescibacteria group bacterium]|jgi:hypothetical protein
MKMKSTIPIDKYYGYIKRNSNKAIYIAIIGYAMYILFFLYQNVFIPFYDRTLIDPALVLRKKEVINQTLFEQVINNSKEKTKLKNPVDSSELNPF